MAIAIVFFESKLLSNKGWNINNYMSIYAIPVANEYDQSNVWPLTGKQITIGIVELGFFSSL